MSLPAFHLLKITGPTDAKRKHGEELSDWDRLMGTGGDSGGDSGGEDEFDFDALLYPKGGGEGGGEGEGEGEGEDAVWKEYEDYEKPEYPKLLILDFDHTMHRGMVAKYTTSTYAGAANKERTEEEELDMARELAEDAENVKEGKDARVGVAGMTADNPQFEHLTQEEYVELFGGEEEIERMQTFFENLEAQEVYVAILTFSPEAAVIKALKAVDLLKWFTDAGHDPGNKVYGKTFFDEAEAQIKAVEKGEGAVDKSVGVMILIDTLFEAFKEELTTAKERSEVTVVYVDDDYENVSKEGSGVVPMVFENSDYNMHNSKGIVHKWTNVLSQKKRDQMNSFPLPFSSDFEDIELALDLEGWVKQLSTKDLNNLSKWWNAQLDYEDEPLTIDELKYQYERGGRKAGLQWCQRARALAWSEDDEEIESK